jgi:hypothetical protein
VIKARELSDPKSCLNKALDHEYIFVLLERDQAAPKAIREWVTERIYLGLNSPQDEKIQSALRTADEMEKNWIEQNATTTTKTKPE